MKTKEYDFIIIGSGPAGISAAEEASKHGKSVLVVEKESVVGGVCINTGTFPSKTLREAVLQLTGFYQRKVYNLDIEKHIPVSIEKLNKRLNEVRTKEHKIIENSFKKHGISLIHGSASIKNQHEILVSSEKDKDKTFKAENIILATGSTPRTPEDVAFDKTHIFNSTSLLEIGHIPEVLTVIGGGVIGTEYATIFAALGIKVNLIDKGDKPLRYLDNSIIEYLKKNFPYDNVKYHPNLKDYHIEKKENEVHVTTKDNKVIKSNALLYALGRIANTNNLGLDQVGIKLNEYDYIKVNDLYQTNVSNIYAIGDVIGWPSLASTSILQGRLAVLNALKLKARIFPSVFPYGIYTIPEISYIGLTEDEAKEKGMNVAIGFAPYYKLPRGQISGDLTGLLKMVIHAETKEILGVHVIGNAATEIIHTAQMALNFNVKADLLVESIFNYPTHSEALKIAAQDALSKVKI